jgi:lipoprotein-releasing system permease protein
MLRFEATLAFRHLRSGGSQTALTVSAVAAGVIVVVFITSLIFGVQLRIRELITDLMPHVTVTPLEPKPTPLPPAAAPGSPGREPIISTRVEAQNPQRKNIENWPQVAAVIQNIPHVRAVTPAVIGQGFVGRGARRLGVQVFGASPEALDSVTPIAKYVFTGHYLGLAADEIVINYQLAQDLGVWVGDRVRLTSSEEVSDSFLVTGIYDTGQQMVVGSRAYVTLRSAQSLFATGTAAGSLLVRADDLFRADQVADRIAALLPYKVESWSRQAPQTVSGLKAQRAVAGLISVFSLIASSFAIASVLIVSVLQRSKQIGILKSMGAKNRQILLVFTLEGLGIAVVGASLGALVGCLIVWGFAQVKQPITRMGGPPEPLLPSQLSWQLVAIAMLAAVISTVVAAILPARRAARMDPVQVLR